MLFAVLATVFVAELSAEQLYNRDTEETKDFCDFRCQLVSPERFQRDVFAAHTSSSLLGPLRKSCPEFFVFIHVVFKLELTLCLFRFLLPLVLLFPLLLRLLRKHQADALAAEGIQANSFLLLNVPDEMLIRRVVGRRLDPDTGDIYHVDFNPPPAEIVDRSVLNLALPCGIP